jgi:hypothetical protein
MDLRARLEAIDLSRAGALLASRQQRATAEARLAALEAAGAQARAEAVDLVRAEYSAAVLTLQRTQQRLLGEVLALEEPLDQLEAAVADASADDALLRETVLLRQATGELSPAEATARLAEIDAAQAARAGVAEQITAARVLVAAALADRPGRDGAPRSAAPRP